METIIKRKTFRSRLLKYFGLIIVVLTIMSALSLYQAILINTHSNRMFQKLFITSSLTVKMGTVHQNLKNYINYENESLVPLFKESLDELVSSFTAAQTEIIGESITTENQFLFYKFADIRNMVDDYSVSSMNLVSGADFNTKKFNIFDSFYELEKLKDFIYLSQTDLIFRQMVVMERFFLANKEQNRKVFILLAFFAVSATIICVFASIRITKALTEPINSLVSQARKVSIGIFEPLITKIKTSAELFILINSFNQMVKEIKTQILELEEKANIEKKLKEEEIKTLRMSNALNESELLFLQSQMNPHFLFNTINIISAISDIEDAPRTREMLDSMTVILRYILRHTGTNTSIREEVDVIRNYLSLQKARFGDRIIYKLDIGENCLDWLTPSMIIQPLVENAIVHGLEPKEEDGILQITIIKGEDGIEIVIADDGVGITEETLLQIRNANSEEATVTRQHMGIVNIMRRMELSYRKNCLSLSSIRGKGTTVKLTIPASLK